MAHYNLGALLQSKDDIVGAEAAYRRAIEIAPELAVAHGNLGLLLKAKADAMEAAGGGGKELAALLIEVADHWEVKYGKHDVDVVAARKKAAGLVGSGKKTPASGGQSGPSKTG